MLWLAAAMAMGLLVAVNPVYAPKVPVFIASMAWFIDLGLVLILWMHPIAERAGVLLAGVFLAIPCFVPACPLFRGCLMCCMFLPLGVALAPVLAPSTTGFRARLAFLCSWCGARPLEWKKQSLDTLSLFQLGLATMAFAAAFAAAGAALPSGRLLPGWLFVGIMIFAFAEMVTAFHRFETSLVGITTPSLMQSPVLSASVNEFWSRRWNPAVSVFFRRFCFDPMARRVPALALVAAFFLSGVVHALVFYVATMRWNISLVNGSFFLAQPILIFGERRFKIRKWPMPIRRTWTLSVLAITSPLFVGPLLQALGPIWGTKYPVLRATGVALAVVIVIETLFLSGALMACSPRRRGAVNLEFSR